MIAFQVVITDAAFARIRAHARFIAIDCEAPVNAQRWLGRVLEATDALAHFPRRCPVAAESELRGYEIRALVIDGYVLLYTVNDRERLVTLIGARHGHQLPRPGELPES